MKLEEFNNYADKLLFYSDKLSKEGLVRLLKNKAKEIFSSKGVESTIEHFIEDMYGYSFDELKTASQKRKYAMPRAIAMYLLKKYKSSLSNREVGEVFNRLSSSTTTAIKKVSTLREIDKEYKEAINTLINRIEAYKNN